MGFAGLVYPDPEVISNTSMTAHVAGLQVMCLP